jgi:hypothetical protein
VARPLLNTLLNILKCLPLLQELTLSRAISSDLSSPLRSTQIRLVHLQRLHLHGDFVACFKFLSGSIFLQLHPLISHGCLQGKSHSQ